jgi:hypothetical protein
MDALSSESPGKTVHFSGENAGIRGGILDIRPANKVGRICYEVTGNGEPR